MTGEMVPCMHMDDRRKIRENYVCAYSLGKAGDSWPGTNNIAEFTEEAMEDEE